MTLCHETPCNWLIICRATLLLPSLLPLENGWLFSAHPSECRISSKSCNIQDIQNDCRLSWGRLDESSQCAQPTSATAASRRNCLATSHQPNYSRAQDIPMVSGLVEERPLFYMHFMKWLITWGQGSILLLPIISEPSEARTESTRRKSEIMAGYCRPPLSRTAVYCFVLCTLLFISHGLYLAIQILNWSFLFRVLVVSSHYLPMLDVFKQLCQNFLKGWSSLIMGSISNNLIQHLITFNYENMQ